MQLNYTRINIVLHFLPPMSMAHTENIFSALVFAETFPNPTLVRLVHVKYNADTYADSNDGIFSVLL